MVRIRVIKGKKVPLPGNDNSGSDPRIPRSNTTSTPFDDEYNRKEQEEFIRQKSDELDKRESQSTSQKKQARFDRVFNLNLGHAKGFLIKATPVLVQLDPTLSSVYTSYKVGKYGYCFLKQVNEDYKTSGDFEESLKTITKQEVENKITSKIKSLPLEKGSQYAANKIWTLSKETLSNGKMDPKWDKFGESALAKTFEEIGDRLL